jgi:hypothetical protein
MYHNFFPQNLVEVCTKNAEFNSIEEVPQKVTQKCSKPKSLMIINKSKKKNNFFFIFLFTALLSEHF